MSNKSTIEWCEKEEERIKREHPDYWKNILLAGRMQAIWRIEAEAQRKLDAEEMIERWPMAKMVATWPVS